MHPANDSHTEPSQEPDTEVPLPDFLALIDGLIQCGKHPEADSLCRQALEPLAPFHHRLGQILLERGEIPAALEFLTVAASLAPREILFQIALARTLLRAQRYTEALWVVKAAIRASPESAMAHALEGIIHAIDGCSKDAVVAYQRATELDPNLAIAWNGLGVALVQEGRIGEATSAFRRVVELQPTAAESWSNLGATLYDHGLSEQGRYAVLKACELAPDSESAFANRLFFATATPELPPETVFAEHKAWGERACQRLYTSPAVFANDRNPERRLRIGYLSPDFRNHPVGSFITPLLAAHDRRAVEIYCYSNHAKQDSVTHVIRGHADHWRNVRGMSDAAIAAAVREDRIDLLIDLAGHTSGGRMGVFAQKPAPVQVTYLGYPNTTGLPTIDYRITDRWADPPGLTENLHTEKLVRPFESFLCFAPPQGAPAVSAPPSMTQDFVTFGSFNHVRKINEPLLALWSRVLRKVPASRLLLKAHAMDDPACRTLLVERLQRHGIAPERVEVAPYAPSYGAHMATYGRVDVALDTHPYHGTTTTCEALWMGVPTVTLAGDTHCSRVGVSLLTNVGLPGLVAVTTDGFVGCAVRIAEDIADRARLRTALRGMMRNSPLMDAAGFASAMESAYRNMWREWCASHPQP